MTPRRHFEPQAHQLEMLEHAYANPRCAWWAGMGSGKTSSALTLVHNLELLERGRTLVMAPLRVARSTWPNEAAKWDHLSGLSVVPIVGTEKERIAALKLDASVHTINYDVLPWLIEYIIANKLTWRWSRVVADESTRLKNFRIAGGKPRKDGLPNVGGGQRARAIARVAHTNVKRWINLTGTPSPNGLKDLWGQTWYLDAGVRLGRTLKAFQERWFAWQRKPDPTRPQSQYEIEQIPLPFAQEQIQGVLSDICITPTLPYSVDGPVVRPVYVELPSRARAAYDEMEKKMFTEIGGHELDALNAAAKTMKCLQLASGTAWVDAKKKLSVDVHDVKMQALESIIEEAAGMPVLVRYHWVPSRERILKAFRRARHLDEDPQTERDWNAGRIPILVAHAQSAGHGLNLQDGSNIMADYDLWWDLEQDAQILERIGPLRQKQSGYNRPVFRYRIIAKDTVDELVIARIESKREVQDILLEAMKRRNV